VELFVDPLTFLDWRIMNRYTKYFSGLALTLLLTACGGGGGEGGTDAGATGDAGGNSVLLANASRARPLPAWQTPTKIGNSNQFAPADEPNAAVNANGVAYVVWTQSDLLRTQVFSSRYINGAWQPQKAVSDYDIVDNPSEPQVVAHPDGRATAIWSQKYGNNNAVYYSSTNADGFWLPQTLLKITGVTTPPLNLRLKADGRGKAMAVWQTGEAVVASHFNGTAFTGVKQISISATRGARNADLAMDQDSYGNALAVWIEYDDNGNKQVFSRSYSGGIANGSWSPNAIRVSNRDTPVSYPRVALNDHDKAVVTWTEYIAPTGYSEAYRQVFARIASGVSAGEWKDSVAFLGEGQIDRTVAAMDSQGRAVVAWEDIDRAAVKSAQFDGTQWRTVDIASGPGRPYFLALAMDGFGRTFVMWTGGPYLGSNLFTARLNVFAGEWGPPEEFRTEAQLGFKMTPTSLAVGKGGHAVAAWLQREAGTGDSTFNSLAGSIFK
jgi:hypothetical protein